MAFLLVVAVATAMTVPVVGALLIFSLMIGPPAAARSFTDRPLVALLLSVAFALVTVWAAIAISYLSNWPIGFFVGTIGAVSYGIGRGWTGLRQARGARGACHAEIIEASVRSLHGTNAMFWGGAGYVATILIAKADDEAGQVFVVNPRANLPVQRIGRRGAQRESIDFVDGFE